MAKRREQNPTHRKLIYQCRGNVTMEAATP